MEKITHQRTRPKESPNRLVHCFILWLSPSDCDATIQWECQTVIIHSKNANNRGYAGVLFPFKNFRGFSIFWVGVFPIRFTICLSFFKFFFVQIIGATTFSWSTRIKGFAICFVLGFVLSILGIAVIPLGLKLFALLYTLGNVCSIAR